MQDLNVVCFPGHGQCPDLQVYMVASTRMGLWGMTALHQAVTGNRPRASLEMAFPNLCCLQTCISLIERRYTASANKAVDGIRADHARIFPTLPVPAVYDTCFNLLPASVANLSHLEILTC